MPIIVIEGCDFCGKGTMIRQLRKNLPHAVYLHEPGSTQLADYIHEGMKTLPTDAYARQLFMHGCRLDMLANYDNLSDKDTLYVIDRYVPSTIVYGLTDGVPISQLIGLLKLFPVPAPDITFILAPEWETIKARFSTRYGFDKLEESEDRLEKVYDGYFRYSSLFPGTFPHFVLDEQPLYAVLSGIRRRFA